MKRKRGIYPIITLLIATNILLNSVRAEAIGLPSTIDKCLKNPLCLAELADDLRTAAKVVDNVNKETATLKVNGEKKADIGTGTPIVTVGKTLLNDLPDGSKKKYEFDDDPTVGVFPPEVIPDIKVEAQKKFCDIPANKNAVMCNLPKSGLWDVDLRIHRSSVYGFEYPRLERIEAPFSIKSVTGHNDPCSETNNSDSCGQPISVISKWLQDKNGVGHAHADVYYMDYDGPPSDFIYEIVKFKPSGGGKEEQPGKFDDAPETEKDAALRLLTPEDVKKIIEANPGTEVKVKPGDNLTTTKPDGSPSASPHLALDNPVNSPGASSSGSPGVSKSNTPISQFNVPQGISSGV
jgi:hypothetical protein